MRFITIYTVSFASISISPSAHVFAKIFLFAFWVWRTWPVFIVERRFWADSIAFSGLGKVPENCIECLRLGGFWFKCIVDRDHSADPSRPWRLEKILDRLTSRSAKDARVHFVSNGTKEYPSKANRWHMNLASVEKSTSKVISCSFTMSFGNTAGASISFDLPLTFMIAFPWSKTILPKL